MKVEPGDTVVLYTDGVTDEETPTGEKFGGDRLYKLLEENADLDAEGIIRCVADSVSEFMAGATQKDDLTILALKFT